MAAINRNLSADELKRSVPEKVGNLTKKGAKVKNWKNRLFILKGKALYYFAPPYTKPKGVIDLEQATDLRPSKEENKEHCMELCTPGRNYFMYADSAAELQEWTKLIRRAGNITNAEIEAKRVFGKPLSAFREFPSFIVKAVNYLSQKGVGVEGIFRLSGQLKEIDKYKDVVDSGEDVNLNDCQDPHVIASLLKLYFRELPEPLFPFEYYPKVLSCLAQDTQETVEKLKPIMNSLPKANRAVLEYLLSFLRIVCSYSNVNKMTTLNLATVFGPVLLTPDPKTGPSIALAIDTANVTNITAIILDHSATLFPPSTAGSGTSAMSNGDATKTSPPSSNTTPVASPVQPRAAQGPASPMQPRAGPSSLLLQNKAASLACLSTPASSEPPAPSTPQPRPKSTQLTTTATVLYDYTATADGQLSLSKGTTITVYPSQRANGWVYGEFEGKTGYFPENYATFVV